MSFVYKRFFWIVLAVLALSACGPNSDGPRPTQTPVLQFYATVTSSPTPANPAGLLVETQPVLPTPTPFNYKIVAGDTLSTIAEKFGVSLDDLMAANPGVIPSALRLGQDLHIPTGSGNLSGESTPTPVPFPVQQAACYPTLDKGMWCLVLVHNNYAERLENITAQVTLQDANGKQLASQTAFSPLNILPPGASIPLTIFFAPEIPPDAHPLVQVLTAVRLLPGDKRYLPAVVQNTLANIDWSGKTAQVSGQVFLPKKNEAASHIWVAAVAYDKVGNVVGVRRWEAQDKLGPGSTLPFEFMISSLAGEITRVEFVVEARP